MLVWLCFKAYELINDAAKTTLTLQDYIEFAKKNGIVLSDKGSCQFCGGNTTRGIHECVEVFSLGFQNTDFSKIENHIYRFFIVDAHALQHPEIHGRWSNHFHLTRLQLIFKYQTTWSYKLSPRLSECLNKYKARNPDEYLTPPIPLSRGKITSRDIIQNTANDEAPKTLIRDWAAEVYQAWSDQHDIVDIIARQFLAEN